VFVLLTLLTGTALGAAGCDAGALATPAALGKLSASQLADASGPEKKAILMGQLKDLDIPAKK
jgi:hypothetical protein